MDSTQTAKVKQICEILPHLPQDFVETFVKNNSSLSFEGSVQQLLDSPQPVRPESSAPQSDQLPALERVDDAALALAGLVGPQADADADADLQRALQMSLQDQQNRDDFQRQLSGVGGAADCPNPYDRKRVSADYPCGLKNVGNTCYINSLLQAYFTLVQFRDDLLASHVPRPSQCGNDECKQLIAQLQLVFASMLLSKRSYVNPTGVVELTPHHGQQEDPTEFNNWLMERIHQGFSPAAKRARPDENLHQQSMDEGEDDVDLISLFFSGEQTLKLQATEPDGSPVKTEDQVEEVRQVIVPVPTSSCDLHDCLREYTSVTQVEGYTTPSGASVTAERITVFASLPAVLTVQLNRISWMNNAPVKNNSRVSIPLRLFMDRYLLDSLPQTMARRLLVEQRKEEERELQNQLNHFRHYLPGQSLSDNLRGTLQYLERTLQGSPSSDIAQSRDTISSCLAKVDAEVQSLEERLHAKQVEIAAAYDDFPRNHPYSLHAILVHSGHPASGHYWAYIYNKAADQWWKFNDIGVTPVSSERVMEQSFGGDNNHTSAYALIYADPSRCDLRKTWDSHTVIPTWCQEQVLADNVAFASEIKAWDDQNSDEGKVNLFLLAFERCQAETIGIVAERSSRVIPSVKNFAAYLSVIGRSDLVAVQCARVAYQEIWKRNPAEDELIAEYREVFVQADSALVAKGTSLKLANAQAQATMEMHRRNFDLNCRVAAWIISCLTAFLNRNMREAFRALTAAKLLNEEIGADSPNLTKHADGVFLRVMQEYSNDALRREKIDFQVAIDVLTVLYRFYPNSQHTAHISAQWQSKNRVSTWNMSVHNPQLSLLITSRKGAQINHDFAREASYPSTQALFDEYAAKMAMLRAALT